MAKQSLLLLILLSAALVFAQTQATHSTHQPATAHRATSSPTKVTGAGVTTPSGLQYWNIRLGTGPTALRGQKVKVDYTGWLTNGKKFDSSVGSKPFEFTIGEGEVIKGWDEGVQGMKVGGKRQLRIPPALGYGPTGTPGGPIPPNATLIFDVRLVSVAQ
jgi:FKBP-type peptidyl-prolyl cis-trans isomerase